MQLAKKVEGWVAIILTLALAIHCIIEGFAVGAADSIDTIQSEFIAIAFHKLFVAYALGNSLVQAGFWEAGSRWGFFLQAGVFVGITLVGIALGWSMANLADESIAQAILKAITAGSFLFVGALELTSTEMSLLERAKINPCFPIVGFLLGYCLMAMLAIWC